MSAPIMTSDSATVVVHDLTLSAAIAPAGTVKVRTASEAALVQPIALGGSASFVVSMNDTVKISVAFRDAELYESIGRALIRRDTTIDVVSIPTRWQIARGAYVGSAVSIDLVKAYASDADGTRFINAASPSPQIVAAWPESAFPLAVSNDTLTGVGPWTSDDSTYFWQAVGASVWLESRRGAGWRESRFDHSGRPMIFGVVIFRGTR
jgi:hypothetical protein